MADADCYQLPPTVAWLGALRPAAGNYKAGTIQIHKQLRNSISLSMSTEFVAEAVDTSPQVLCVALASRIVYGIRYTMYYYYYYQLLFLYDVYAVLKKSPYLSHECPDIRLYGRAIYTEEYDCTVLARTGAVNGPFCVDLSFPGLAPAQVSYTTAPIRPPNNCPWTLFILIRLLA
jgi:hypothetical protein